MIITIKIIMHTTNINEIHKSRQDQYLINNGRRYEVSIINYFKQQKYIVYEACIFDSAFMRTYITHFRFKGLKKLHEQMMKHDLRQYVPEFPKTHSFGIWNKTNEDPKLIQDRIRDLEYYLVKLLNNGQIHRLPEMQYIRKSIRNCEQRRSFSYQHLAKKFDAQPCRLQANQCPQFYRKKQFFSDLL